jgi:hypothetical protein
LGGALIAGTISLLNVSFATIFTRLAGNTLHVSWLRKGTGFLAMVAGLTAAAVVNLGAGHLRDATERLQNGPEAAIAALASLRSTPLELQSLQSWMLVAIGLVICAIAAAKARAVSDPYPGFAQVWSKVCDARDAYADELKDAVDEIQDTAQNAVESLLDEADRAKRVVDGVSAGATIQLGLKSRLKQFHSECDQAVSRLLAIYSEANRSTRKTPAPDGFCAPHVFEPYEPPELKIAGAPDLARVATEIDEVATTVADAINKRAADAIATYPDILEMEDEVLGEYAAVTKTTRRDGGRLGRVVRTRGERGTVASRRSAQRLAESDAP